VTEQKQQNSPPSSTGEQGKETSRLFHRLYEIVRILRSPEGCPWDREQTPFSLRANLVEEAYESISAIEDRDDENLQEELGDIFLVGTMIAHIKEQEGSFSLADVLQEICEKLIRRHPHVFGDAKKDTPDEVVEQWEHIKAHLEGKKPRDSVLERVPRTLPPLERAYEIQNKVSKVGFDWKDVEPLWDKLAEEIGELRDAQQSPDPHRKEQELGDLLFTVINVGRLLGIDPTLALNGTNQRFIDRFQQLEQRLKERGIPIEEAGLERMDAIWEEIKREAGS
jgi:tetrapyrrole methylase family protein/MazG family protein